MLEDVHDRLGSMATLELPSEGMVDQFESCLFLIALQGSVEEQLEPSARRIAHRITQMEEICLEVENKGCVRIGQTMEVWSRGATVHTSGANTHSTAPKGPFNDKRQVLLGTRDLRSRSRNPTICPLAKYGVTILYSVAYSESFGLTSWNSGHLLGRYGQKIEVVYFCFAKFHARIG